MTRPANPFAPVIAVASVFSMFDRPWFLAGGWAIDLFLQRVSRDHEDIDIAVLRRDQSTVQSYLANWTLMKTVRGRQEPWRAGERVEPSIHEVHALRTEGPAMHLELLFEETSGEDWTYRRDPRITRPLTEIATGANPGIPVLVPEIVLLYKAKKPAPKDEADFDLASPRLGARSRKWLKVALETVHPGHPWIRRL